MSSESGFTSEVLRYVAAEIHVHSVLAGVVFVANHRLTSEGAAIATSAVILGGTITLSVYRHHRRVKAERLAATTAAKDPKALAPDVPPAPIN